MHLTGSETVDALVALGTGNNANPVIVTKAALHGYLERFGRGELSRMDLFEIAEYLQLAAHAVPEPRYESAIEAILEKLAHYPLEEDAPLSTSRLQYELDHYRPVAPILGFEDMATLRSTLGHPEQPTAHVTRKACTIWLERLGDGDLTTDELVAMARHLLGHEPVEAEPVVREFLAELVEPGLSKEAILRSRKLDQNR